MCTYIHTRFLDHVFKTFLKRTSDIFHFQGVETGKDSSWRESQRQRQRGRVSHRWSVSLHLVTSPSLFNRLTVSNGCHSPEDVGSGVCVRLRAGAYYHSQVDSGRRGGGEVGGRGGGRRGGPGAFVQLMRGG